jgi:ketosteroid isomerase-like protein
MRRSPAVLALSLALALPGTAALAQRRAPPPPPPAAPAIDPEEWWSIREAIPTAEKDPLAGRRWSRRDAEVQRNFSNGVDASLYRLWGLQPLQTQVVRRGEAVYETWYRPTNSTRQAVVRITVRNDGRTFVQARAGRGCCAPEITRRIDLDFELASPARDVFRRLKDDPLWRQPRHVVVSEGGDVVTSLCVDGSSYDLTLVDDRRAVHLRRSCDPAEIGSVAPAARAMIGAALGKDPRFDVLFAKERFDNYQEAYAQLTAAGGSLAAADASRDAAASQPAAAAASEAAADPVAEILAADRAFAARSSSVSAAQAFREFMASDGLLFRNDGEPIEGPEAIFRYFGGDAAETGKLTWEPAEAWASEAGDFGASWGRSRFTPKDPAQPARGFRYMTVWRKNEQGEWRGLMDMGAPAADLVPRAVQSAPAPARR